MKQTRHKFILFCLVLLFILPGLSAYLFYMNPQWLNHTTTNKGHFLNPPARGPVLGNKETWQIILWSPNGCDAQCMKKLEEIARVRLALGRRFYDVELWLLMSDTATSLPSSMQEVLKKNMIFWQKLPAPQAGKTSFSGQKTTIFIANPTHYLVLEYHDNSEPNDIFYDIKHLLTTTVKAGS